MKKLPTALTLTLGITLAGCAQAPSTVATTIPLPTPPALSETARNDLADKAQTSLYEDLTRSYPGVIVPAVTRERFIRLDEFASVMAPCMTAAGFPSYASADGGLGGSVKAGDEEPNAIATYVCTSRFPVDPKYSIPLNKSQITYLYTYQTAVLTPCLEKANVTVDPPPTLPEFIDGYLKGSSGGWAPYKNVIAGALGDGIYKQCPQTPEHLYG